MIRLFRKAILTLLVLTFSSFSATAADAPGEPNPKRIDIINKLADHNYLDFKPIPNGKIPLPRIIVDNGNFYFYLTTTAAIQSETPFTDEYYATGGDVKIEAGKIKPVSYHLVRKDGGAHVDHDFSITSHLVWFALSGFLVLFVFGRLASRYAKGEGRTSAPKGFGMNFFEVLVIFIRDEVAKANIGEKKYMKFTPYLLTAFFMILFMNLFGLLPWGVSSTADLSITAALAISTFLLTQFSASKDHWGHVFAMPGVPKLMLIIITPIEILGLFTKPFALAVRLFANMASGKMLVYSIIGMIFIFAELFGDAVGVASAGIWIPFSLFIYALKVFASFLQAYIFTMFSALFIGLAVEEHDHHHDHGHADKAHAH